MSRLTASTTIENLHDDASVRQFVAWFRGVTPEQVRQVLEYAGRSALEAAC